MLTAAGLIQGNGWLNGETVYRILPEIHVYMVLRAAIGMLLWSGGVIGLYNIAMSIYAMRPPRRITMKMTPAILIFGSLIIFTSVLLHCGDSAVDDDQRKAVGNLSGTHRTRRSRASDLYSKWVHLLPHPVREKYRLGLGGLEDRSVGRLHPRAASSAGNRTHRTGSFAGRGRTSR